MEAILTEFFKKHPQKFSKMTAIKCIHKEIEKAQHCLKKDKTNKEYLKYLASAYRMLEDLFEELKEDPNAY